MYIKLTCIKLQCTYIVHISLLVVTYTPQGLEV